MADSRQMEQTRAREELLLILANIALWPGFPMTAVGQKRSYLLMRIFDDGQQDGEERLTHI